ncbi:hypothetical protein DF200_09950 [Bifidobacterium catulorum]|uniref:Uncharacterized protein n=1 Tax=Bifidobacterium catulorum TaxID=1630173 RepID=A0A2U2MQ63_9BIFI|nr:hypothetical protein DF200_09950 [Bifidobacterium catulorum]
MIAWYGMRVSLIRLVSHQGALVRNVLSALSLFRVALQVVIAFATKDGLEESLLKELSSLDISVVKGIVFAKTCIICILLILL